MVKKLFITLLVVLSAAAGFAVNADISGDGVVDSNDLLTFFEEWLQAPQADPNCDINVDGDINLIDYVMILDSWTGEPFKANTAPVVTDANSPAYTNEIQGIELSGTDADEYPNDKLYYVITSEPNNGTLTDISLRGGVVHSVPYTLKDPIELIQYVSDANFVGEDTFTYQAWDGEDYSNTGTVTITVSANPVDNLSFDGQGYITIPDADEIEFDDDFHFSIWIKTDWPYGGILRKRGDVGPGFELELVEGRIVANFYDPNGYQRKVAGDPWFQFNTGEWVNCQIARDANNVKLYYCSNNSTDYKIADKDIGFTDSFANDANLIIGSTLFKHYRGELDRITWYSADQSGSSINVALISLMGRSSDEDDFSLAIDYHTRFEFNEGSGNDVNDEDWGLTGTISSTDHVNWVKDGETYHKLKPKKRGRERQRPGTFHFRPTRIRNGY